MISDSFTENEESISCLFRRTCDWGCKTSKVEKESRAPIDDQIRMNAFTTQTSSGLKI